jgi:hypothetical protein
MYNVDEVMDRMKVVLCDGDVYQKVYDKDIAIALGISVQSLTNYKARSALPTDEIGIFCAKRRISYNWLVFNQLTSSLEDKTMRYVGIKYAKKVDASNGGGASFVDNEDYEIVKFPWYMLEELKQTSKLENIHIINITGDSNEPVFSEKDRVFVDSSKTEINNKDFFVVKTPYGIYIKKIKVEDNQITLVSENPIYFDEQIDYDIEVIGTIVGKF